ncbi:MAG: RelA/SpoT family protein [Mycoplasma sp.]
MIKKYYLINTKEELFECIKRYIQNPTTLEFIEKGYQYANEKHKNQLRKSGEPYFTHLLSTAYFLAVWELDPNVIVAGLLHDVIEDQNVTREDLAMEFNEDVAHLVDAVTKLKHYTIEQKDNLKTSNLRKIILAMTQDIRVLMIKLADRLHNMLTIKHLPLQKQFLKAEETDLIYTPIASRLGFKTLTNTLNYLTFKVLNPQAFEELNTKWNKESKSIISLTANFLEELTDVLKSKVEISSCSYRIKSISSIHRKILQKNKSFEEIYDLSSIKIVVKTIPNCYEVFGIIQSKYETIPDRFKDYIVRPKENSYSSLHLVVCYGGKYIEVQIRTKEMEYVAIKGLAAHWAYKENISSKKLTNEKNDVDHNIHLLSSVLKYNEEDDESKEIQKKSLEEMVFKSKTYVLTPQGDFISLNGQPTALDFAFRIHSNVGEKAKHAIINGRIMPLNTILKSGDVIEIKTNPDVTPNISWYDKVSLKSSRDKIRKYLQAQEREIKREQMEKGKKIIMDYIDKNNEYKIYFANRDFLKNTNFKSLDRLYESIGVTPSLVSNIFLTYKKNIIQVEKQRPVDIHKNSTSMFLMKNLSNIRLEPAHCCLPIPFDQIVGYVTKNSGIKVHRKNCYNCKTFNHPQIIPDIHWNNEFVKNAQFITELVLHCKKVDKEFITQLSKIIFACESVLLDSFCSKKHNISHYNLLIKISVKNHEHLNKIIIALREQSNISLVFRK